MTSAPGQRRISLLWTLHVPLGVGIVLSLLSLQRPATMASPRPAPEGTQWLWVRDRVRLEMWNAPVTQVGRVHREGATTHDAALIATGTIGYVIGNPNGTLTVHRGRWFEFRFYSAVAAGVILSLLTQAGEIYHRKQVRHKRGLCPTCGYDLRATPERCPECGRERETSSAPSAPPR